ncbi:MAG: alpha/beta hydrolase [Burkholderiales bacterium]|nr:alpha/beta hydrolase [Burkholderiales bacterium]
MKLFASLIALGLMACAVAESAPAPTLSAPTAATMTFGQSFTLDSRILSETRRINVYTPPGYAEHPEARLPVIYMPDGGMAEDFPHVVEAVDALVGWGSMRPVIVVGIENTQRRRDLTGPTDVDSDKKIAPVVGGSAAYRQFIRRELMPQIRSRFRTTDETAVMGESLAGLFVVETLELEPDLFDTYIAFSPSLWWNHDGNVQSFAAHLKALPAGHKTFYMTSADEDNIAPEAAQIADMLRAAAPANLSWHYQPMPQEFHDTIYRASAPRALRTLFAPKPKAAS